MIEKKAGVIMGEENLVFVTKVQLIPIFSKCKSSDTKLADST